MPLNRRDFLKKAALVAAGVVAADQLELLERLTWKRSLFPGFSQPFVHKEFEMGFTVSRELLDDDLYRVDSSSMKQWQVHFSNTVNSHIMMDGKIWSRTNKLYTL